MKREDFKIGARFKCGGKSWMCTDIGNRVITAVCLTAHRNNDWGRSLPQEAQDKLWAEGRPTNVSGMPEIDPSWLEGPPYAIAESVFDEYDQPGCFLPGSEEDTE